jgi:SHS2 domain-containing protein
MTHLQQAGYRERPHTADWELQVWAPDLAGLLVQAALGMYALCGVRLQPGPHLTRTLVLSAPDDESLLVRFLQDLLYLSEIEGLAFDELQVEIQDDRLRAQLHGAAIAGLDKEIKAVTFHNLRIERTPLGLETRIVFDV